MTEHEKKLILSKDEYEHLIERFRYDTPLFSRPIVKQINYYFDTDDLSMNRQSITCRIRLKDGVYKATMKQHLPNTDHSIETRVEIHDGIDKNAFTDMGLVLQGELMTERCVILKDAGYEVVLDKNTYLGQVDYELEIEYAPECEKDARAVFQVILDTLAHRKGFPVCQESYLRAQDVPSKSNRFFERKSVTNQDVSDYSDPDDYMRDYYGSATPDAATCGSCAHFDGNSCEVPYGSCAYKER